MTVLDLNFIRGQFPAFAEGSLQGFAHFDNAGGSYACRQTIEWLDRYVKQAPPRGKTGGTETESEKESPATDRRPIPL